MRDSSDYELTPEDLEIIAEYERKFYEANRNKCRQCDHMNVNACELCDELE